MWKNRGFSSGKNAIFFCVKNIGILLAVLYWTVDGTVDGTTRDAGQWTVDSGQWTVDSGQWTVDSGQWTGHSVLDRGSPGPLDNGRWTSGQWTGQSGQKYCPYSRILRVTLASF